MRKILLFLGISLWSISQLFAQEREIILKSNHSGNTEIHEARDGVYLKSGFSYKASSETNLTARVNSNMISKVEYLSSPPSSETHTLNTPHLVGTTPGNWSVSLSGEAIYSLPVFVSPGTAGVQPQISISYSSQGGSGLLGVGWNLGGLSAISRIPQNIYYDGVVKPVQLNYYDRLSLDGNRLLVSNNLGYGDTGVEYGTENETFSIITPHDVNYDGPQSFKVWDNAGWELEYGATADARICGEGTEIPYMWRMNKATDPNGNYITYEYATVKGESRIVKISYTGNTAAGITPYNTLEFIYGERKDKHAGYVAGYTIENKNLLESILVKSEDNLVKKYIFQYTFDVLTHLSTITEYAGDGTQMNPIIIDWGKPNKDLYTLKEISDINLTQSKVHSGDFNGDGKSDILQIDRYGNVHYFLSTPSDLQWEKYSRYIKYQDAIVGDVDNDGLDDVILTKGIEGHIDDTVKHPLLSRMNNGVFSVEDFKEGYYNIEIPGYRHYDIADFDGDGINDVLMSSVDYYGDFHRMNYCMYSFVRQPNGTVSKTTKGKGAYSKLIGHKYQIIDMDGDGRKELISCSSNILPQVLQFEGNSLREIYNGEFSIPQIGKGMLNYRVLSHKKYVGDPNADGKTDIITYYYASFSKPGDLFANFDVSWFVNYSDGEKYLPAEYIAYDWILPNDPFLQLDIDGDGKDDGLYPSYQRASLFVTSNDYYENRLINFKGLSTLGNDGILCIGDFTGDGIPDFLFKDTNNKTQICAIRKDEKSHRVHGITNGLGQTIRFAYKPLTDTSVYTKGNTATYPVVDHQIPLYVVSSVHYPNDIGDFNYIYYRYSGAKMHLKGLGLLGFTEITQSNPVTNKKTINTYAYHSTVYSLSLEKSEEYNLQTGALIFRNSYINSIKFLGKNRYFPYVTKQISIDEITEKKIETTYTYDFLSGKPEDVVTSYYSNKNTPSPQFMKTYSEKNFITRYRNLRTPDYTQNYTKDPSGESNNLPIYLSYDSKGNLISLVQYRGNPLQLTTSFEYTSAGLPKKITYSNAQSQQREQAWEYDTRQRWKTKETSTGNFITHYQYDSKYGNLLSETTPNGLTTRYEYNTWGSLIKTNYPDGNWIQQDVSWFSSSYHLLNRTLYKVKISSSNAKDICTYYNASGKEILTSQEVDLDKILYAYTIYDAMGRVDKMIHPQPYMSLTGHLCRFTGYEYDWYGQLIKEKDESTGSIGDGKIVNKTYTYDRKTNKNTIHDHITGVSTLNEYDLIGRLLKSTTPAAVINYSYFPDGKLQKTESIGGKTEYTYDIASNCTSINESNTGKTTYEYNGFGELISKSEELEGMGNSFQYPPPVFSTITTYGYTPDGRIASKMISSLDILEIYTYRYNEAGVTKGLINSISHDNSSTTFEYDSYGNTTSVTKHIDGKAFPIHLQYNSLGKLQTITYPGINNQRFAIDYLYDKNKGGLTQITNSTTKQPLWLIEAVNDLGMKNMVSYGNALTSLFSYEPETYRLARVKTSMNLISVADWQYTYEKGLMKTRKDKVSNQTETFTYDAALRLSSIDQTIQKVHYPKVAGFTYNTHGNMTKKSDIGTMSYYSYEKPHALKELSVNPVPDPLQKKFSADVCRTTYTPFHKIKTITNEKGDLLEFTYGTDQQRIKTVLKQIGKETKTTYFIEGIYELEETSSYKREQHYIYGDQWVGIYVKDSRFQKATKDSMYYVYTNHIGSFERITNEKGVLVQSQSFDAWGNRRDASNWRKGDTQTNRLFTRGFSGHEHLDAFELINMNGRLYDPVVGQFLSVDPLFQEFPGISPYSYCGYDPINWTDPTGLRMVNGLSSLWNRMSLWVSSLFASSRIDYSVTLRTVEIRANRVYLDPWGGSSYHDPMVMGSWTEEGIGSGGSGGSGGGGGGGGTAGNSGQTSNGSDIKPFLERPNLPPDTFTGFWGTLDYFMNGGCVNGSQYSSKGKWIGVAPRTGTPPLAGTSGINIIGQIGRLGTLFRGANVVKTGTSTPSFIVSEGGTVFPVPKGAIGPLPATSGKGFQFIEGVGGNGLSSKATGFRFMDPVTTGKYQYHGGYGSYFNRAGQTINPYTGQTISPSNPWWHIPAK